MTSNACRQADEAGTELEQENPDPGHEEKHRACLVCGDEFLSTWSGERVCKRCRGSARWRQG